VAVEQATGRVARTELLPMQPGDVAQTAADTSLLQTLVGSVPQTEVEAGVAAFVDWWREWKAGGTG